MFVMFKGENQDCEIGFSLFPSLRPKNALLLKNQPLYRCKCSVHENSYLLLNALGINVDKISFWRIVLCESEDYTSSCWKGECNNCCNGKTIPFSKALTAQNELFQHNFRVAPHLQQIFETNLVFFFM